LRGVFDHKNVMGGFAGLGLLLVVARLRLMRRRGSRAAVGEWLLGIICVTCLALSESATPFPVLAAALFTLFGTEGLRRTDRATVALAPFIGSVAAILFTVVTWKFGEIAGLLDRSSDLSGRTEIWEFALQMIPSHLWAGYGYGAFWVGPDSPGAAFWHLYNVGAVNAHDGYIQMLLDGGVVALALFVAAILTLLFRLGHLLRHGPETHVAAAFALLVFLLVKDITEDSLWLGHTVDTLLLVYLVVRANFVLARARAWRTRLEALRIFIRQAHASGA
jgi:exopolysaccharide production protein ExoQ